MVRIPRTRRKKTSIYIDEALWDWFVPWTKDHHTSTCHILEPFLYALKTGSQKLEFSPLPKIDLTLNISREVLRARRRERVSGDQPIFQDLGTHLSCHFCHRISKWMVHYVPGWDQVSRVYCCGYHVRRYRRMTSLERGYPRISFHRLYKGDKKGVKKGL